MDHARTMLKNFQNDKVNMQAMLWEKKEEVDPSWFADLVANMRDE